MRKSLTICCLTSLFALAAVATLRAQSNAPSSSTGSETILKASEITSSNLFPDRVFYRGKTAPSQLRNTGGIHFADGFYFLAGLVDTSGYSTAVAEKYQAYVIAEVALDFNGQQLKPGAYGAGFVGGKFIVTDLGANELFEVNAQRDTEMKRPIPLQVVAGAAAGAYRLYHGRDFVDFRRSQ